MEIYLTQGKVNFQFPVVPPDYELESTHNNTSENVSAIGEVNLLGKRNLKTIPITSFFPKQYYNFCSYEPLLPSECVDIIDKMKNNGVARLIMTGSKNINMLVTIESFAWGENDATGDINFTIELKEYRYVTTSAKQRSNKGIKKATIYLVKKGDTLQGIKKVTGTSKNWKKIKEQNNLKSNELKPGQKLVILQ